MIDEVILCAFDRFLHVHVCVPIFSIWLVPVCVLFRINHFEISFDCWIIFKWSQYSFVIMILNFVILYHSRLREVLPFPLLILINLIFKTISAIIFTVEHFVQEVGHVEVIQYLQDDWKYTSNYSFMWVTVSIEV